MQAILSSHRLIKGITLIAAGALLFFVNYFQWNLWEVLHTLSGWIGQLNFRAEISWELVVIVGGVLFMVRDKGAEKRDNKN
ncbi:MAG: hypothetical protein MI784_16195 [Cytophagales bacterium]|nr:hypothetical protein [Cytophagales bacterium]